MAATALALPTVEAIEAELARRSLLGFTRYTFPEYAANWHHHLVARTLDQVLAGTLTRLMLFLPPQNGKSELVSRRFPPYALGRVPSLRIVACSYSATLANDMSRDVQRIMDGDAYRRLFPLTRLPSTRDREVRMADQFQIVGQAGSYTSVGVQGGLTGKSMDIGVIDDPVKNREEAESETYRKNVWDWYTSTFHTRQFGDSARIVICLTRWHEDDLAGKLLALARNNPAADQWTVLSLPAIAEAERHPDDRRQAGEALWPEKYPLEELAKRRASAGEYNWSALYQQHPTPAEGGLIKRGWWKWYAPDHKPALTELIISLDPAYRAKETNDYAAMGAWGKGRGPQIYGLKALRGRWEFPELLRQVLDLHRWCRDQWPDILPTVLIEKTAAGPDVISELRTRIPGVIAESPKGEKTQRVHAILPLLESGNVWLPGGVLPDGRVNTGLKDTPAWVEPFVEECAAFPMGAHDDQVDQCTQALRRLHRTAAFTSDVELKGW